MENKIRIPFLLLAVSLSLILLFADNLEFAYAVTIIDLTDGQNYSECANTLINNMAYCIDHDNTAGTNNLIQVNMASNTIVNTYNLKQSGFSTGALRGLWISGSTLFTLYDSTVNPFPEQIIKFSTVSNTVTARYNFTFGEPIGQDVTVSGNLLFIFGTATSDIEVYDHTQFNLSTSPAGALVATYETATAGTGISLFNDGTYVYSSFNAGTNNVQLWTIATSTQKCNANIGTTTQYYDFDNDNNLVVGTNGNNVVRYSTTCTISNSFSVGASAVGLQVDEVNNYYYVGVSNGITAYDYSNSNIQVFSVELASQGSTKTLLYSSGQNKLLSPMPSSNEIRIIILGASTETPTEEFCSLPENENILTCRLEAEGNTGLSGTSQLVNQSATNVLCQVGFLECTQDEEGNFVPNNPDVQTNGVGYILVVIAMSIFVGLLWVGSRGQMVEIPTFVWFIGTIGIVATFTAIEYIDPTFLVITIIVVAAFAVAKAKGVLSGSELFKGESF